MKASAQKLYAEIMYAFTRLRSPSQLQWWEWGKIIGAVGLVALATLLVLDRVPHPAVVAVLLHIAGDFTFQSHTMACRKRERGHHLLAHALMAGGLPLAVAGLVARNLGTAVIWGSGGATSHYLVDWSRRFGVQGEALGIVLDQGTHLLIILALVLMI